MSDKNNMVTQPVSSVQEYLAILEKVLEHKESQMNKEVDTSDLPDEISKVSEQKSTSNYLFRGLPNVEWRVQSTASLRTLDTKVERHLGNSHTMIDTVDLEIYDKSLAQYFRHESFKDDRDSDIMNTDLGILTQLQHYGAATSLIDFTSNPLVALWFACLPYTIKDNIEAEGKVSIVQTNDNFIEISSAEQLGFYTVEEIYTEENKLFYWKPSHLNKRIPAQSSYFIFGKQNVESAIIHRIIISNDAKSKILKVLSMRYGINQISLFPDMSGFAQANSKDSPHNMDALYERKITHHESNIQNFKRANKNKELSAEYLRLGQAKSKLKKLHESELHYTEAITHDKQNYKAYYARGVIYYQLSNILKASASNNLKQVDKYMNKAIKDFEQAAEINTKYAPVLNNLASAKLYLAAKKGTGVNNLYKEAILYCEKAAESNPNYFHAYLNWGMAENLLENYVASIEKYNTAIKIDPSYWPGYYNRGLSKVFLSKESKEEQSIKYLKEAIEDFEKIVEVHPSSYAGCWKCIEYCNELAQKIQGAEREKYLHKVIKYSKLANDIKPNDSNALFNAAYSYYQLAFLNNNKEESINFHEESIKLYNAAMKITPGDHEAYHNRGASKAALNRLNEAVDDYKETLEMDSSAYNTHYSMGMAYYNLQKRHDPEAYRLEALKALNAFIQQSESQKEVPPIKKARDEATQIIMELDAAGKSKK